jgi:hypothetical protein
LVLYNCMKSKAPDPRGELILKNQIKKPLWGWGL